MLTDWMMATVRSYQLLTWILPPLMLFEAMFPKSQTPIISRLRGLAFLSLSLPAYSFAQIALFRVVTPSPLAIINLSGLPFSPILGLVLAAIIGDFWFYWMHRVQHRFLWRFHSVHHAIEYVSASNSYHHFSEGAFQAIFMLLPGALFVRQVEDAWALAPLAWAQGIYLHSTTRAHLGPLRYIVGDNRFHRIHHSTDPAHFDKNFSGFAPVWDVIFGTAYFPKANEWPDTGLADKKETLTTWDWLTRPFRA